MKTRELIELNIIDILSWSILRNQESIFIDIMSKFNEEFYFNINRHDENKTSFLLSAVNTQNPKMVKILLEHGADINQKNSQENSPLLLAAYRGNTEIVKLLVENGANIEAKNMWGIHALVLAECNGHTEIVEYLKEAENKPRRKRKKRSGERK